MLRGRPADSGVKLYDQPAVKALIKKFPDWMPGPGSAGTVAFAPPDLRKALLTVGSTDELVKVIKQWQKFSDCRCFANWRDDNFIAMMKLYPHWFGPNIYAETDDDREGRRRWMHARYEVLDRNTLLCTRFIDRKVGEVITTARDTFVKDSLNAWYKTVDKVHYALDVVCRQLVNRRLVLGFLSKRASEGLDSMPGVHMHGDATHDAIARNDLRIELAEMAPQPDCLVGLSRSIPRVGDLDGMIVNAPVVGGFPVLQLNFTPTEANGVHSPCTYSQLVIAGEYAPTPITYDWGTWVDDIPPDLRGFGTHLVSPFYRAKIGLLAARWQGDYLPYVVARNGLIYVTRSGSHLVYMDGLNDFKLGVNDGWDLLPDQAFVPLLNDPVSSLVELLHRVCVGCELFITRDGYASVLQAAFGLRSYMQPWRSGRVFPDPRSCFAAFPDCHAAINPDTAWDHPSCCLCPSRRAHLHRIIEVQRPKIDYHSLTELPKYKYLEGDYRFDLEEVYLMGKRLGDNVCWHDMLGPNGPGIKKDYVPPEAGQGMGALVSDDDEEELNPDECDGEWSGWEFDPHHPPPPIPPPILPDEVQVTFFGDDLSIRIGSEEHRERMPPLPDLIAMARAMRRPGMTSVFLKPEIRDQGN